MKKDLKMRSRQIALLITCIYLIDLNADAMHFPPFFIITPLNDLNISYRAHVLICMAHIIWVNPSSENSSSALIYAII